MSESGLKLLVWVFAAGMMGALLLVPQPVAPWEMPSLQLLRTDVAEALAGEERKRQIAVSADDEIVLRDALLLHGEGEIRPLEGMHAAEIAKMEAREAAKRVADAHGAEALDAVRVRAADAFEEALVAQLATIKTDDVDKGADDTQGDLSESRRIVGGLMGIMEHYGARNGKQILAPALTLRAMYKARWNAIFGRDLTEGFVPAEQRAYWGWLALQANAAPWALRERALIQFRNAGGLGADEAGAMIAMIKGAPKIAAQVLQQVHDRSGMIRPRNLALGALAISQQPSPKPRVDTPRRIP